MSCFSCRFLPLAATLAVAALASVLPTRSAQAITLTESLGGNQPGTFFPGHSLTTIAGGPFNNIAFNFFEVNGFPTAAGTLFILNVEYTGTPAALSGATPGLVAQSTGITGGIYNFNPGVTLQGSTQYFVYANQAFLLTGGGFNTYPDGGLYSSSQSGVNFASVPTSDANFRLTGTAITAAPEPGTLALVAIGLMGTAGMVIRHRHEVL